MHVRVFQANSWELADSETLASRLEREATAFIEEHNARVMTATMSTAVLPSEAGRGFVQRVEVGVIAWLTVVYAK